ncbi:hypothetical protein AA313_de0203822 [Arthrobotrys entomopaga]|nr:hypothetical protein AA313_de0203822 [Arthrobotrys entomopaga]
MTALAVASREPSSLNIVELGGSFGTPVADLIGTASTEPPSGSTTNSPTSTDSKSSNSGAIAGGVVGGVLGLLIIAGGIFFFLRRHRQNIEEPAPPPATTTPIDDNGNQPMELISAGVTRAPSELHSSSAVYKANIQAQGYYGQPGSFSELPSPNNQPNTFSELPSPRSQPLQPNPYANPVVELPG